MSLTVSLVSRTVFGDQKVSIADVTFDSSYPTGGESLDLGQLGLNTVNFMQIATRTGHIVEYDYTNKKLIARTPTNAAAATPVVAAAAAEVANTTNLATVVVRVLAFGT